MTDAQVRLSVIAIGAVFSLAVIFIFYKARKAGRQNQYLNEHKQLQEEQQRALDDYEKSIRKLLAEIEEESCNIESAIAASEQCRQYIGGKLTGQPIVDALLAYKRKQCSDRNIQLEIETAAFPSEGFSEEEYVGLLGNLLDNGMEAAEKTSQPWVRMKSFITAGQWILQVTNSKTADEAPLSNNMKTTKEEKENHGFGGKIVKRIVKKYKGVVDYRDYGDYFEAITAIPLAKSEGRKNENVECGDLR